MSRKKREFARKVLPDVRYGDIVVTKMVNAIMHSGKKSIAERAFYRALDILKERTKTEALDAFHRALANVSPVVEVRSRRVGGATYQVPTEVRPERARSLGIRWLIGAANERSERTLSDRLAAEMLDATNNRGGAIKKREDAHKMAEANRAFAHFRW